MTPKGKRIINDCFDARLRELKKEMNAGNRRSIEDDIKSIEALKEVNAVFGFSIK